MRLGADRTYGLFDGTGHATTRQVFLDEVARGVGVHPRWLRAEPGAHVTGMTRQEETGVLGRCNG